MYEYGGSLRPTRLDKTGVHDGDTIYVHMDMGCDISFNMTIRLYGINAPELATPAGKVARDWAINWFRMNCPDNQFIINTIQDKTEKYGRYLAVITAPNHAVFNNDIISAGQAVVYLP